MGTIGGKRSSKVKLLWTNHNSPCLISLNYLGRGDATKEWSWAKEEGRYNGSVMWFEFISPTPFVIPQVIHQINFLQMKSVLLMVITDKKSPCFHLHLWAFPHFLFLCRWGMGVREWLGGHLTARQGQLTTLSNTVKISCHSERALSFWGHATLLSWN